MTSTLRWTSADLELLPDDGKRREIIDGELYVSKQPGLYHQEVCGAVYTELRRWSREHDKGRAVLAPGVIFAEDDDVAPDVVWISSARLNAVLGAGGHLHGPPELVVEVLSPGTPNKRRDREAKLKLYSRRGVSEYWIADWEARSVEVYRQENGELHLAATLSGNDSLDTPLLEGFAVEVSELFEGVPKESN
jgi:Uma2 family endonuclease